MSHCNIEETLERHALHKTKDRHRILELFEENRTWTAKQIHRELRTLNLTTVYRNIQKLTEAGIVTEVHSHHGEQHFEKQQDTHHDHFLCASCDIVKCVPCPIPKQPSHILELTGTCKTCK